MRRSPLCWTVKMDKAISYLSLAAKAGKLVIGEDDQRKAARKGKASLLVLAADAAPGAIKRASELSAVRNTKVIKTVYTKSELAHAVGRGSSVALLMLIDEGLSAAFTAAAAIGTEQEESI